MNQTQLIDAIATQSGLTKACAAKCLKALTDAITNSLESGEEVSLSGLGKFSAKKRLERVGRNPKTGEQVVIPAHKTPAFRASQRLKTALNQ